MTAPDGLLIVDKPTGWTSHDVVGRTRRLAQTRKVGHAGTLDPMATGVLVLGIGRATRLLTYLVGCDKEYVATVRLGQRTVTDDAEGDVTDGADATGVTMAEVEAAATTLTGDIDQVPSAVSAIKVDGQRSYARVRAGQDVELAARPVHVARLEVANLRPATDLTGAATAELAGAVDVDLAATVSSGTYVRALARDLGERLGVGGHLTMLRRTRVGSFTLGAAHPLQQVSAAVTDGAELPVIPLAEAATAAFAVRALSQEEAWKVARGQRIPSAEPGRSGPVAAVDEAGTLVGLLDESRATARSLVVFAPASS